MLRSLSGARGYAIHATDGEIGHARDFYFDDRDWTLRYLVVDTGSWLRAGEQLLVPTDALGRAAPDRHEVTVHMTADRIRRCPTTDAHKPVSRQHEAEVYQYFGLPPYWNRDFVETNEPYKALRPPSIEREVTDRRTMADQAEAAVVPETPDPHLRSSRAVMAYRIHARDGDIGEVHDLIVDDDSWTIRLLVVDTGTWLPGRRIPVAVDAVDGIDETDRKVDVNLLKQTIREGPDYDPADVLSPES